VFELFQLIKGKGYLNDISINIGFSKTGVITSNKGCMEFNINSTNIDNIKTPDDLRTIRVNAPN
jgi:hypothetical protein